jgi:hypothetical protein
MGLTMLAEHGLDSLTCCNTWVRGEVECRRPLHPHLAPDRRLNSPAVLLEALGNLVGQRGEIDAGVTQIRIRVDSRHRDEAEPLVDVTEPLQLLGHDFT